MDPRRSKVFLSIHDNALLMIKISEVIIRFIIGFKLRFILELIIEFILRNS